jgi:NADPH:quinone reductase-like Zn-dependent oxidoreductase
VARDIGLRHGEAHIGKQPAGSACTDVTLRLVVRLGARRADDVESKLTRKPLQLRCGHVENCAHVKAIRIHEDGGTEVLRYEDAPDPSPGEGEVLVRLRAAALNRIDIWIRTGQPSVPKPRILGSDGAGERTDTGERVVINPGLDDGARIIGEHLDGTDAELIAVPEGYVHPIPDALSFEEAAAFPLVFETAYRMLVTKAALQEGEWVLLWGIGGGVGTASLAVAKALRARVLVTSSSDAKLERARELGADAAVNHATGDVAAAVKAATGGAGVDVVVEHVGAATWKTSLAAVRHGGRVVVCGATSGANPPAQLHRVWWKQLTILGSTMGAREARRRRSLTACRGARRARAPGGWRAVREDRAADPGVATREVREFSFSAP